MTRQELIELAHKADCLDPSHYGSIWVDKLEKLTELIEQHVKKETKDKLRKWASTPLYEAPPQRKPLTDEEIDRIIASNAIITDQNLRCAVYEEYFK